MKNLVSLRQAMVGPAPLIGAAPRHRITVVAVQDVAALRQYIPAWEGLAAAAIEPNVFHEPWMLLPALEQFAAEADFLFVLIFDRDGASDQLCGFFPLQRQKSYKGLPLAHLRIWRHLHCVLSTPLLRAGHAPETLQAFFDWLNRDGLGSSLLELDFISADGPFQQALTDHLNQQKRLAFVDEITTRGLLRISGDGDAYLKAAISGEKRKKLAQKRRRLGQLGRLESRVLERVGDLDRWTEGFLAVEASGWKGKQGTALACRENERRFFEVVVKEAFARQRLFMLGLFLDDKPVAMKCNFLMGQGSIAFKIAYDEDYARFSPGMLLEVDNIVELHARRGPQWMDSCAVSRAAMFDRLWMDRRLVQSLLVSTGRRRGDLTVSLLPMMRWLGRLRKGKPEFGDDEAA